MIVKTLNDIKTSGYEVRSPDNNWLSRRLLLKQDGMGFSLHDTIVYEGTESLIWYKNHLEAVYCIEGNGEIEVLLPENRIYPIEAGTVYALNNHEKHRLRAKTRMRIICVFNPPCVGNEVHDADGTYPLLD